MESNEFNWREFLPLLAVSLTVVALWLWDQHAERLLTQQERVERTQRLLDESKFTEM